EATALPHGAAVLVPRLRPNLREFRVVRLPRQPHAQGFPARPVAWLHDPAYPLDFRDGFHLRHWPRNPGCGVPASGSGVAGGVVDGPISGSDRPGFGMRVLEWFP